MERIGHQASDSKLAESIGQYNADIERQQEASQAIQKPLDIPDNELATITIEGLESQRAGLLSERLKCRQDAVRLARQRVEILESIQPELDERAAEAEKSHAAVVVKTSKAMTKAGAGPESQQAALSGFSDLAQRQFNAAVQQATPVKEAKESAMVAERQKNENPKRVRAAKEQLADAASALRTFIDEQINGGEVSNNERTHNRTIFDPPRFGKRVSAR